MCARVSSARARACICVCVVRVCGWYAWRVSMQVRKRMLVRQNPLVRQRIERWCANNKLLTVMRGVGEKVSHWDRAIPCHICAGTGLAPSMSGLGLGFPTRSLPSQTSSARSASFSQRTSTVARCRLLFWPRKRRINARTHAHARHRVSADALRIYA